MAFPCAQSSRTVCVMEGPSSKPRAACRQKDPRPSAHGNEKTIQQTIVYRVIPRLHPGGIPVTPRETPCWWPPGPLGRVPGGRGGGVPGRVFWNCGGTGLQHRGVVPKTQTQSYLRCSRPREPTGTCGAPQEPRVTRRGRSRSAPRAGRGLRACARPRPASARWAEAQFWPRPHPLRGPGPRPGEGSCKNPHPSPSGASPVLAPRVRRGPPARRCCRARGRTRVRFPSWGVSLGADGVCSRGFVSLPSNTAEVRPPKARQKRASSP